MMLSLGYYEFLGAYSLFVFLYAVMLDAWHDEKVISRINRGPWNWHWIDNGMKGLVLMIVPLMASIRLEFEFTKEWALYAFIILFALWGAAIRANTFNYILNVLRGLPLNHKSDKGIDTIHWAYKLLFITAIFTLIVLLDVFFIITQF